MISFMDFPLFVYFYLGNHLYWSVQDLLLFLKEFLIEPDIACFKESLGTFIVFECSLKILTCVFIIVSVYYYSLICSVFYSPGRIRVQLVPLVEIKICVVFTFFLWCMLLLFWFFLVFTYCFLSYDCLVVPYFGLFKCIFHVLMCLCKFVAYALKTCVQIYESFLYRFLAHRLLIVLLGFRIGWTASTL